MKFKPSTHVIKGDACIECCLRIRRRINVELGATLSSLYERVSEARPGDQLAMVPLPLAAVTAALVRLLLVQGAAGGAGAVGGAAAAPAIIGGGVVFGISANLANAAFLTGFLEALGLTVGVIQSYFDLSEKQLALARQEGRKLPGDCSDCVEKRVLSQGARRKRQVAKILRRV